MNYGPLIVLAAFFALASSWFGLVLTPQLQLGRMQQTNSVPSKETYPLARPGLARQGLDVYRANGCAACHSQQVGQSGTICDILLTEVGTNPPATLAAVLQIRTNLTEAAARELLKGLPQPILKGVPVEQADSAWRLLGASGAKREFWVVPTGPDISRGWGKRRTVAEDFLFDYPVMPGSQRVGPDLSNVAIRQPDALWHLKHLYSPDTEIPGSMMPPYRFLFEKRRIERAASPDALTLANNLAPPPGYEIVPKQEANALVSYLQSLRADAPLFVAPLTLPTPAPPRATAAATSNAAPASANPK
jgi:cytochrome c oxidase cbb3-type subunit 2